MNQKKDHTPMFSAYHPVIPKIYTPSWKVDMQNRDQIVENCKLSGLAYNPTEATMYLEKRERLCINQPSVKEIQDCEIPREKLLKPHLHSPLSKYRSSLMFRSN